MQQVYRWLRHTQGAKIPQPFVCGAFWLFLPEGNTRTLLVPILCRVGYMWAAHIDQGQPFAKVYTHFI